MQNNPNILLATILSVFILVGWTWFYEKPRIEAQEAQKKIALAQIAKENKSEDLNAEEKVVANNTRFIEKDKVTEVADGEIINISKTRKEVIEKTRSERILIESDSLHGSINLKGASFDDLTLAKYFTTTKKDEEVILFSPSKSSDRYFADFGWVSSDKNLDLPNSETIWNSNGKKLTPENPIILSWKNKQNIEFFIKISLDKNYMFAVEQSIKNSSKQPISAAPYGRINRVLADFSKPNYILHEGAIGVSGGIMTEVTYKSLAKEGDKNFAPNNGGWLGITDKYWLSAIIPDKKLKYSSTFGHTSLNHNDFFNSEFVGQEFEILANEELNFDHHLFAGAKKVRLLDQYGKDFDAKLFDRAVDFGWFYFLTKPFFFMISYLSQLLGNFGLAILAMTVLVKLALFPMASKSYAAIGRIKKLQPKIDEIRTRLKDNKLEMNRAVMELYKREKINPASGCLPILIQIPIFFSLYKVLFVTIDMRHAPFYGWIQDLSAPDPTSIFNLFGLLPFEVSSIFAIGIWPILMGLTMVLQQKLSPASSDPIQAKILKWMPFVLTFVLASFPAGLVIYWTWSNALSILQQWYITRKLDKTSKGT